jgi:hypothetical protein
MHFTAKSFLPIISLEEKNILRNRSGIVGTVLVIHSAGGKLDLRIFLTLFSNLGLGSMT